jgi:hypothetical protein
MTITSPRARTIILTDAGTVAFAANLINYDGTVGNTPTPAPAPAFTTAPTIASDGTPQVGEQLTGVDASVSNLGSNTLTRAWLNGTTALTSSAAYTSNAEGARTFRNQIVAPDGTVLATASASVTIAAATITPPPTDGTGTYDATIGTVTLSNATDPSTGASLNGQFPPKLAALIPVAAQADQVRFELQRADEADILFGNVLQTYAGVITQAQATANAIGGLLSAISSPYSYRIRLRSLDGTRYGPWSNVLVNGDSTAPSITGFSPLSLPEPGPLLITVQASEPSYFTVGGPDAALVEKVGSEPAQSIGLRLLGNAPLDFETKPSYALTVKPADRGGNVGDPFPIDFAVTNADEIPAPGEAITLDPATKNQLATLSNGNLTVAGAPASGSPAHVRATFAKSTGKWYWEITVSSIEGNGLLIGVCDPAHKMSDTYSKPGKSDTIAGANFDAREPRYFSVNNTSKSAAQAHNGNYLGDSGDPAGGVRTYGIALDMDAKRVFYRSDHYASDQDPAVPVTGIDLSTLPITALFPYLGPTSDGNIATINFGATPFVYGAPAGFSAYQGN